MLTNTRVSSVFFALVLAAAGCAQTDTEGTAAAGQDLTARTKVVTGEKAEHLITGLVGFDAYSYGASSTVLAQAEDIACETHFNYNLDPSAALHDIWMTTCTLEAVGQPAPTKRTIADAPPKSAVLYLALQTVSADALVVPGGDATTHEIHVKAAKCDAVTDASTDAKCTFTTPGDASMSVDGNYGLYLARAFELAGANGKNVTSIDCYRHDDPQPSSFACSFEVGGKEIEIDDPVPAAEYLSNAIIDVGGQPAPAVGKQLARLAKLTCTKGGIAPATCQVTF